MENPLTKHIHDTLAFGTYRLSGPTASARVRAALELGFRRIDTAQLYGNETAVYAAIRDFEATHRTERVVVTSKIYENLRFEPTVEKVAASARLLGRPIDVMLLHRPLPPIMWRALNACVDAGHVTRIGVSNHGVEQLEALRQACGTELRPPSVDQVELHPFVGPIHPLLSYCQAHGIRVQGHTALARGELLDFPPLVRLAEARRCSAAVLLLRWAHQLGAALVVQSSRDDHLREIWEDLPTLEPIDARDMATISGFYARLTRRFFAQRVTPASIPELDATTDTHAYVDAVAALLRADQAAEREGLPVSDAALGLTTQTRQQLLRDPVANQIAERLFPEDAPTASHSRYRELVRRLRNSALARRAGLPKPKRTSCSVPHDHPALAPRVVDGTPVSASVAAPSPMPVEVSPAGELAPFFDFLASAQEVRAPATFVRGTYFPDHRMDLCKQVVGPDHVEALCAAVSARAERDGAHQVRHFLLGNNIACAGDSIAGAEAFARLMADPSVAIETWYLAGNAIGPEDVAQIARALAENRFTRALWLKRNPIGPAGAAHLGRLLGANDTLRLLDLHNTGLFDEGVEALVEGFVEEGGALHLRHLYLSANGLSAHAVRALARLLRSDAAPSSIVSLYLSQNRLGADGLAGVVELARAGALARLERLDLGAIGLVRPDLDPLVSALVEGCPALAYLTLGTYKSTRDMGERANQLDPDVSSLVRLVERHPSLELLDVSRAGLPSDSVDRIVAALGPHQSLEGVGPRALRHDPRTRRFLRQPKRVVDIDSIYRGRA